MFVVWDLSAISVIKVFPSRDRNMPQISVRRHDAWDTCRAHGFFRDISPINPISIPGSSGFLVSGWSPGGQKSLRTLGSRLR